MLTACCGIVLQLVPNVANSENDLRWQLHNHSTGYALKKMAEMSVNGETREN